MLHQQTRERRGVKRLASAALRGALSVLIALAPAQIQSAAASMLNQASASGTLPDGSIVSSPIAEEQVFLEAAVAALLITKTASTSIARRGDPVVYTLTASNASGTAAGPVTLTDRLPDGFVYIPGSATVNGAASEPAVSHRSLTFTGLTVPANGDLVIQITVRIAASAEPGDHVNEALLLDPTTGDLLASLAQATVRVEPEHVFDCGEVIGKVFDDRNRNGYQDKGELGLAGVRVVTVKGVLITTDEHGRFSVPCAGIPDADIGSNFILKLDERTLPTGFRVTTENPRVVRLTRGKVTKLNFGAAVGRVLIVDLNGKAFEADRETPLENLHRMLTALTMDPEFSGSTVELNYYIAGEARQLARDRIEAVARILRNARIGHAPASIEISIIGIRADR